MSQQPANRIIIRPNAETFAHLLFDGLDEIAKVELCQSMIEEFCRRYLKSLINEQPVQDAIKMITAAVEREVDQQIGVVRRGYPNVTIQLRPDLELEVRKYVSDQLAPQLKIQIGMWLKEEGKGFLKKIDSLIEKHLEALTEQKIKQMVAARLNAIIVKVEQERTS